MNRSFLTIALMVSIALGLALPIAFADDAPTPPSAPEPAPEPDAAPDAPDAPIIEAGNEVGQMAPDFTLKDQDGNDVKLSDLRGKIVVLEAFNIECPHVRRHYVGASTMKDLAKAYAEKNVVWLAINSTNWYSIEKNKALIEKLEMSHPILDDHEGTVGKAYAMKRTPEMVVIGTDGVIVYRGAIDNDRTGRTPNPTNYVAAALEELTTGKPVTITTSTPYG